MNKEMLQKIVLFTIIGIGVLCSCSQDKTDNFYLAKEIKTNAKILQIDTIGFFEDLIYASDFFVYQDSVLIVQNRKHDGVYFLEFYHLKQQKLIAQLFRLGNGPNEMLSAKLSINLNMLTVVDFVKDQVAFVNIDSVLQNSSYRAAPKRYYIHSPTVALYKENQYLIANPHCFKDDKLGIDNKTHRFIVNDAKNSYVEKREYEYYTWNVAVNGNIITNYQHNRIVFISLHAPAIEIYDDNLTLLKQVHAPDKLPPNYRIVNDFDANEILFKKGYIPFTYLNYCVDKDFFYLTYMGDYRDLTKNKMEEDYPLWIFKFDWDVNFIDSYYIGQYVSTISLSADGQSFYATAISKEKNPFLIKFSTK